MITDYGYGGTSRSLAEREGEAPMQGTRTPLRTPIRPPTTIQTAGGTATTVPRPTTNPTTGQVQLQTPTAAPAAPAGNTGVAGGTPGASPVPAPMPAPAGGGAVGTPQAARPAAPLPQGATPITGQEAPYAVQPQQSQTLQALLQRLSGEATRQLDQPTVYDDALFKSALDQGTAEIDRDYKASGTALNSELAGRGLDYSSVAGGRFNDLAAERGRAVTTLNTNLLRERAGALAAGRSAAFSNASGLAGSLAGLEAGERDELRGERGYTDALRTQARDQSLQELLLGRQFDQQDTDQYRQLLGTALGYGQAPGAAGYFGSAGGLLGSGAGQYGQQAADNSAGLAQLAQLLFGSMSGGGGGGR